MQKVREDGYGKFADIIEGRGESHQSYQKVGGGFGGNKIRSIEVDPVTLVRCRKRFLKAGDNRDEYVEAMRNDGYGDVADVILGLAIATNDPDPDWRRNNGL